MHFTCTEYIEQALDTVWAASPLAWVRSCLAELIREGTVLVLPVCDGQVASLRDY